MIQWATVLFYFSAEEVLVGKLQKVLELLNRIIFAVASGISNRDILYLIAHGGGFLIIPESEVPEFKKLLVKYYEGEDPAVIADFMKERCWKTIGH